MLVSEATLLGTGQKRGTSNPQAAVFLPASGLHLLRTRPSAQGGGGPMHVRIGRCQSQPVPDQVDCLETLGPVQPDQASYLLSMWRQEEMVMDADT